MGESVRPHHPPSQSGERLLIAEDDEGVRMLISTVLKRNGYAVDLAKNGIEAIEKLALSDYRAILLDLNMPMANGFEVISYLELTAPERLSESVIVLTAVSNAELRKLDGKPVFRIMRKPFDLDDLLVTVATCCTRDVGDGKARYDGDGKARGDGDGKARGDGDGKAGGDGDGKATSPRRQ
jgi:CheY-like chemotaxis protein